jgi:hypothetical protein
MKIPDLWMPLAYAGLRVALAWVSPIPGAVVLDPLPILLARQQSLPSRRGWHPLLLLPGLILGDLLAGFGPVAIGVRVLAVVVFLLTSKDRGFHFHACRWTFQFSLATAIVVDASGYYPLVFITLAGMLQGFLWWGILAPPSGGGSLRPVAPLVVPPALLVAMHLLLPSPSLRPLPVLSQHSSLWMLIPAALLLVGPYLIPRAAGRFFIRRARRRVRTGEVNS